MTDIVKIIFNVLFFVFTFLILTASVFFTSPLPFSPSAYEAVPLQEKLLCPFFIALLIAHGFIFLRALRIKKFIAFYIIGFLAGAPAALFLIALSAMPS